MPTPDANAEPVNGDAIPMHQHHHLANRPSFGISPHAISFAAGVGVTLLVLYFVSQWQSGKKKGD